MTIVPKGCTVIYAPPGKAGEYSELATNPYDGCGHKCFYCYVPLAKHVKRHAFDAGATKRVDFLKRLQNDCERFQAAGRTDQIFITFTSDCYHPGDTQVTRWTMQILRDHGLGFCPLTKGGTRALADIDLYRPDRDAFASTLTTLSDIQSRKWESAAPPPGDRIAALRAFHARRIFTWCSLEPVIDPESSLAVVDAVYPFVDLFKDRQSELPRRNDEGRRLGDLHPADDRQDAAPRQGALRQTGPAEVSAGRLSQRAARSAASWREVCRMMNRRNLRIVCIVAGVFLALLALSHWLSSADSQCAFGSVLCLRGETG